MKRLAPYEHIPLRHMCQGLSFSDFWARKGKKEKKYIYMMENNFKLCLLESKFFLLWLYLFSYCISFSKSTAMTKRNCAGKRNGSSQSTHHLLLYPVCFICLFKWHLCNFLNIRASCEMQGKLIYLSCAECNTLKLLSSWSLNTFLPTSFTVLSIQLMFPSALHHLSSNALI